MMFKTWSFTTMSQALNFISDFKLGHYMKIPPRQMFACQVIATIVSGTVQRGAQAWLFSNVKGFVDKYWGHLAALTDLRTYGPLD